MSIRDTNYAAIIDALTAERDAARDELFAVKDLADMRADRMDKFLGQRDAALARVAALQAALEAVTHLAEVCETDRECERGSGRPPTVFSDEIVAARAVLGKPE